MKTQKKMRSDSVWNALNTEQRDRLDEWLFTERVSYEEALERANKEFGITASKPSMWRYYHFRLGERGLDALSCAGEVSVDLNGAKVNMDGLRDSSLKLIAQRLQLRALEGAEIKDLTALARVLLEADWRTIQRDRLALAREKFHFNAAEAALAEVPRVGQMTAEEVQKETERVNRIIQRLFGKVVPEVPEVPKG